VDGDLLEGRIEGRLAFEIVPSSDERGDLLELLTVRDRQIDSIVHVYQVFAAPGSIRAWVYHSRQTDRPGLALSRVPRGVGFLSLERTLAGSGINAPGSGPTAISHAPCKC
jgi:dTDP-4-dehydrorhamnose 3,5-epimerase-like enzyme